MQFEIRDIEVVTILCKTFLLSGLFNNQSENTGYNRIYFLG